MRRRQQTLSDMGVIIGAMRRFAAIVAVTLVISGGASVVAQHSPSRGRDEWIALARSGFALPDGERAIDRLVELNPMLASIDPVLRDDVAFSAAERWIVRDARTLAYFRDERDLRGFDATRGWMHTVAHTSDTLKFLVRNAKLPGARVSQLLGAVRDKVASADTVFTWGENDRMALALQSAVRREDAAPAALEEWEASWVDQYKALWAKGPQVDPRRFAAVDNARQIMRSLLTALSIESKPTSAGDKARRTLMGGLAKMR
jgi:hypothetical protein